MSLVVKRKQELGLHYGGKLDLYHQYIIFLCVLFRAVLAIPFHLACTTYATCQLSRLLFSTVENSQTSSMNQPNNPPELVFLTRGSITESPNSHHHIHPLHFKHVSFMEYLKCLSLPSILHGLYDVGLFLAAQVRH